MTKMSLSKNSTLSNMFLILRIVQDEIYMTIAEFVGDCFSYYESQLLMKVVANRLFKCQWKIPDKKRGYHKCDDDSFNNGDTYSYDKDTLPTCKTMRDMMRGTRIFSFQQFNLVQKQRRTLRIAYQQTYKI